MDYGTATQAARPSEIFSRIENQSQECSVLLNLSEELGRRLSSICRPAPPNAANPSGIGSKQTVMSTLSDRIVGNTSTLQEVRVRLERMLNELEL